MNAQCVREGMANDGVGDRGMRYVGGDVAPTFNYKARRPRYIGPMEYGFPLVEL